MVAIGYPRVREWFYALAILACGFGALSTLWVAGHYPSNLAGLPHYPSATWGDGLFLPLAALSLRQLLRALPEPSHRWPSILAGSAGACVGALVIVGWLSDPAPGLNWTMPEPHHLNFAGWWHAVFLVAASTLFAMLWFDLMMRMGTARRTLSGEDELKTVLGSAWFATALAGSIGYVFLASHDGTRAASTSAGRSTIGALAIAVIVFLVAIVVVTGRSVLFIGPAALSAIFIAAAVVSVALDWHGSNLIALASIAAFATGFALASTAESAFEATNAPTEGVGAPALELIAVPCLFVSVIVLGAAPADHRTVRAVLALLVALVGAAALRWTRRGVNGLRLRYVTPLGISLALLSGGLSAGWLSDRHNGNYVTGGFILTLVGTILGGAFLPYYKEDYRSVIDMEISQTRQANNGHPTAEENSQSVRIWSRIGGYAVAAFTSLLALTVAVAPSLGWKGGDGSISYLRPLVLSIIASGILLLASPCLKAAIKSPEKGVAEPAPRLRRIFLAIPSLSALVVIFGTVLDLQHNSSLNYFAAIQAALLSLFAAECVMGNGARLHLSALRWDGWVCVTCVAMAAFLTAYWSLTFGVGSGNDTITLGWSFVAWLGAAVLIGLLTTTATATVYVVNAKPYKTQYSPLTGAAQDVFMVTILWLVVAWLPQITFAHIPHQAPERWAAVGTILAGFLLLFGPAFLWVLETNDTHNGRECTRLGFEVPIYANEKVISSVRFAALPRRVIKYLSKPPQNTTADQGMIWALDGHTAVQNSLALLLAGLTVVGTIGIATGLSQPSE